MIEKLLWEKVDFFLRYNQPNNYLGSAEKFSNGF